MAGSGFPDIAQNFNRTLALLQLSTEQLRVINPSMANLVKQQHLFALKEIFDQALTSDSYHSLKLADFLTLAQLDGQGFSHMQAYDSFKAPPGLGKEVFKEALPKTNSTELHQQALNPRSPPASSTFGVIGDRIQKKNFAVHSTTEWQAAGLSNNGRQPNSASLNSSPSHPTAYKSELESIQEIPDNTPTTQGHPTWAKIAALHVRSPSGSHVQDSDAGSSPIKASFDIASSAQRPSQDLEESLEEQKRAIWIFCLPRSMSMHHISCRIPVGPIMSIYIEDDVYPSYPGRSACIVFRHAVHAMEFLRLNNAPALTLSSSEEDSADEDSNEDAIHTTSDTKQSNALFHDIAPTAVIKAGELFPFSASPYFALMDEVGLPSHAARRRVKWSRARLFYDVRIETFKADVLRLASGPTYVECFHFYNPGEATVVFASVAVAKAVLDGFEAYRAAAARPSSSSGSASKDKDKDKQRKKLQRAAAAKIHGTYGHDFEVSYARDWNEAPPDKLTSQYAAAPLQAGVNRGGGGARAGFAGLSAAAAASKRRAVPYHARSSSSSGGGSSHGGGWGAAAQSSRRGGRGLQGLYQGPTVKTGGL